MKLTAIVASYAGSQRSTQVGPREFDAVDEFAAALGAYAGAPVEVIEGTLADAPTDGYVLAFDVPGLPEHPELGRRLVVMNADRGTVSDKLERYQCVAAIERLRYFRWRTDRDAETGSGVIGRKELAPAIGATMSGMFASEHYDVLASPQQSDLPGLLAAYLAAHVRAAGGGA